MVVCIEFVMKEMRSSTLFLDLAREHEGIPFVRVTVSNEEKFENVRNHDMLINPRRMSHRLMVVVRCVCLSVCLLPC